MKIKKISAILMVLTALTLFNAYILPSAYTKESAAFGKLIDSTKNDSSKVTYTCPMHPEVTSDKPGQCPKCGMDLELQKKDEKEQGMNSCPNIEKCKQMGCNMNDCKGHSGGCMNECPMMKEHKDHDKSKEHDHNSNDNDDNTGSHKHKSGCKKGC